ncbi:MAG: hypothetical protein IKZ15_04440, partial [Clostridia bacterium]|nr:hypothetical protein [Clostridia bacterium]
SFARVIPVIRKFHDTLATTKSDNAVRTVAARRLRRLSVLSCEKYSSTIPITNFPDKIAV